MDPALQKTLEGKLLTKLHPRGHKEKKNTKHLIKGGRKKPRL